MMCLCSLFWLSDVAMRIYPLIVEIRVLVDHVFYSMF